ncbi:MAG: hypothetical protein QOJ79_2951 [Actinomycetota bacterium]|jgi:hypothetical protein|nr:hypothetical protein [Actinomycetota bacterium]
MTLLVRRTVAVVAAVLLLLAVWTAWALLRSRSDLHAARDTVDGMRSSDATVAQARTALSTARDRLQRAEGRLSQPGPALFARLPLAGRTPRAALLGTRAGLAAVVAGQHILSATADGPPLVDAGRIDQVRLAAVARTLRQSAADLAGPVGRLRTVRTGWTPGEISRGVQDSRSQLDGLPATLTHAADVLDALAAVTGGGGPRRLLVVLENNAELRGTGGIVTVFAEATARDGRVRFGSFRDVDDVADPVGQVKRVPSPGDYHRLWGQFLADTTLWKNANMSPDVATSSAVLARIAATSLGRPPDSVLWLDVRTLADIIGATSSARLPDGTVLTKDSTVPALLSGAYKAAVDTTAGQAARRARLRGAADAVAARLFHGRPDASRLALALAGAARGRHLALWSAHPQEQRAFSAAGLAGEVRADGAGDIVSAVVQNFGGGDRNGNKLDYYARRLVTVHVRLTKHTAEVEQEFSLRNTAPPRGLPVYVSGAVSPGTSNNFVTLAVPAGAELQSFTRGGTAVHTDVLAEGDHRVVTDAVSLPAGTTATWRLRYRLRLPADGSYTLHAFPQPLAVDGGLNVEITGDGVHLATPAGRRGGVGVSEPFQEQRTLRVVQVRDGVLRRTLDAVRRFWNEPVHLPF